MKPALPSAAALLASAAIPLLADVVTYNDTPSQLCVGAAGCGLNTQAIGGGLLITFNPVASAAVVTTVEHTLGEIQISCIGGGTGCGPQNLAGLSLFLNIAQIIPTPSGSGSIAGVLSGVVSGTSSTALVTWMLPSTTVGAISYTMVSSSLFLSAPNSNGGSTDVRACISSNGGTCPGPVSAVPEPSAWITSGTGAAFLGLLSRRRRRRSNRRTITP